MIRIFNSLLQYLSCLFVTSFYNLKSSRINIFNCTSTWNYYGKINNQFCKFGKTFECLAVALRNL